MFFPIRGIAGIRYFRFYSIPFALLFSLFRVLGLPSLLTFLYQLLYLDSEIFFLHFSSPCLAHHILYSLTFSLPSPILSFSLKFQELVGCLTTNLSRPISSPQHITCSSPTHPRDLSQKSLMHTFHFCILFPSPNFHSITSHCPH